MWGRFKDRLYWWYLFPNTKKAVDVLINLSSTVLTCILYIPIVFLVIIWIFISGRRT